MIFVTVGGQLPFDRLVMLVDEWVAKSGRTDVFAQVGAAERTPEHVSFERFLSPDEFARALNEAAVIVAHAGMGTIIKALELGKPIVVFPRREALGEQRNDHQLATAGRFRERGEVRVAMDADELRQVLDNIDDLAAPERISSHASTELLDAIRDFVDDAGEG